MSLPTTCLPGQPLPVSPGTIPGPGTYISNSEITSTLTGLPSYNATTKTISVSPATTLPSPLPTISSTVLARVTRINPRQATVAILSGSDTFQGVIRQQDIRATEKDKVKVFESFRPGDVVRAKVISLGDLQNYYLTTAGNSLGVVMAVSEEGEEMVPVSWREMRGMKTGKVELRKVAKPI
ncbi:exoribonuclease CSL4 [Ascodesmis nigricans]|uniref:Exoribonuclease CSL4 n=1 Tax=Ascodesmis nigricans TaxID=341454 RepID=A0A4S2N549_9PEZI|nr:exoribonuclease CSL4 [Ascodesmis nigricans]